MERDEAVLLIRGREEILEPAVIVVMPAGVFPVMA
jgi:hypothetical protein